MKSLKRRFAAIVLVSILVVVGLATAVTMSVLGALDTHRSFDPQAEHMQMLVQMLQEMSPEARAKFTPLPTPDTGDLEVRRTQSLEETLRNRGLNAHVFVAQRRQEREQLLYISLDGQHWMVYRSPGPPPFSEVGMVLAGWLSLIIVGAGAIALTVANVVTRPYDMLEDAIASVGSEGIIPLVEVRGTGEARATAAAINRLSTRLKSAMESRMRLVAAAGHDLRTPMTRMWLRTEFLPEEDRAPWVADLRELDRIADSAIRLVREEAGGTDRETIPLHQFTASSVTEIAETGLNVRLLTQEPAYVSAGPLALKRALRNLLINAATHGGGCSVTVGPHNGFAVIVIEDQGPGIPEDIIEQVFEPFFSVDQARQRSIPGAGLGMAISKEIVERFGGTIAIENREEGGLRQIVSLPLVEAET